MRTWLPSNCVVLLFLSAFRPRSVSALFPYTTLFRFYGGWGLDSTGTNGNGALDDLWVYTPNATAGQPGTWTDRKSTRLNSSHGYISYAVFCLKKKTVENRLTGSFWFSNVSSYKIG